MGYFSRITTMCIAQSYLTFQKESDALNPTYCLYHYYITYLILETTEFSFEKYFHCMQFCLVNATT
jgi:hypothetical protein